MRRSNQRAHVAEQDWRNSKLVHQAEVAALQASIPHYGMTTEARFRGLQIAPTISAGCKTLLEAKLNKIE